MTTISTDPVARTEILARIRPASTDITNSDPVADVPIEWEYGTGIDMDDVVGTFVEKVIDYKATVVRVKGADVPQAVVEGLRSTGAEHSAVVPVGRFPSKVFEPWPFSVCLYSRAPPARVGQPVRPSCAARIHRDSIHRSRHTGTAQNGNC